MNSSVTDSAGPTKLSPQEVDAFDTNGYLVLANFVPRELCEQALKQIKSSLDPLVGPAEYEADVGYPGAPADRQAQGGSTPRRLLHAYARGDALEMLGTLPVLAQVLRSLMHGSVPKLSQCHHNCVMTKHPGFSSATLWHQDIRYWSFDQPDLISAWFALGTETRQNGALKVIPGSHRLDLDRGRFDKDLFLRPELEDNRDLIHSQYTVELNPGDVLLFHCRVLHAAGKNLTDEVKLSPVFTYHSEANLPIPGTRSARLPSIELD